MNCKSVDEYLGDNSNWMLTINVKFKTRKSSTSQVMLNLNRCHTWFFFKILILLLIYSKYTINKIASLKLEYQWTPSQTHEYPFNEYYNSYKKWVYRLLLIIPHFLILIRNWGFQKKIISTFLIRESILNLLLISLKPNYQVFF